MVPSRVFIVVLCFQIGFVLNANAGSGSSASEDVESRQPKSSALLDDLLNSVPYPYPYEATKKSRLIRSPGPAPEDDDDKESEEFVDELNLDPRKDVNEFQTENDPRKLLNKHEAAINTKVQSDSDADSKPGKRKAKVGEVLLPEGYNVNEIPRLTINGTLLQVPVVQLLTIRSLLDLDEVREEIVVDVDTIITWADGQLFDESLDHSQNSTQAGADHWRTLNPIFLKQIWTPDIYIDNLLRVRKPSYLSAPVALKFNQKLGYFRYRSRITLTLKCPMEFHFYPADTQKCLFFFKSYAYFSDELQLVWAFQGAFFDNPEDANFDIQIDKVTRSQKGERFPDRIRYYDVLEFYVFARRKLSYHLIQTYLPSVFFIIITWLTFLLPPSMVEVRIGIAMTTLLTLTAMFSSVRESTPSVSYTKAIDVWMIACIVFVFLTLLEFTVLAWLETDKKRTSKEEEDRIEDTKKRGENGVPGEVAEVEGPRKPEHTYFADIGYAIEKFAFPIFAGMYAIFIAAYWAWLLIASEYFSWEINKTHNLFSTDTFDEINKKG